MEIHTLMEKDEEYSVNPFREELPMPDTVVIVVMPSLDRSLPRSLDARSLDARSLPKHAETTDLIVDGFAICCLTLLIQRYCSLCFIGWNVSRVLLR